MRHRVSVIAFGLWVILSARAFGGVIFSNPIPNGLMAIATRPGTAGQFEIEAGDDFILSSQTSIDTASFAGLLAPAGALSDVSQVVVEIYRVFPLDSNTARTPSVPTRVNSPSDVALDSRDSAMGQLSMVASVLSPSFTALNSVQPGGIHKFPLQTTLGNGPVTGTEVQFNVTFTTPFVLDPGHYFFVPQVALSNGGQFLWLSASRPISGPGTTPILPDLQAWTRDAGLDPDWLRVGTDIVGGAPAPTFNAAFSVEGTVVPEPSGIILPVAGLALIGLRRRRGAKP